MNVRTLLRSARVRWATLRLGALDRVTLVAVAAALVAGALLVAWLMGNVTRIEVHNDHTVPDGASLSPFTGLPCAHPERRPLAVMLSSDPEARPLSGLAEAEVVYEIPVTPNAITRLMAVYLCTYPDEIGSVRSARTDFLGFVGALDAIYVHWGGEQAALEALGRGILDNINALVYDGTVFYRKDGIPAPHDGFTTVDRLLEKARELRYTDTADTTFLPHRTERTARTLASSVPTFTIAYPSGARITWHFDDSSNLWSRNRDGTPELDAVTGEAIRAGALIIVETEAVPVRNEYLDVRTTGEGSAILFQDGVRRPATWRRAMDTSPLQLTDATGEAIGIAPGPIWIIVAVPGMTIE